MSEYIEREAAKEAVKKALAFHSYAGGTAASAIDRIPAADVRPVVRGKWIKTEIRAPFDQDEFTCSVCGSWPWWCGVTDANLPNFCPNCGASMVKEGEEQI